MMFIPIREDEIKQVEYKTAKEDREKIWSQAIEANKNFYLLNRSAEDLSPEIKGGILKLNMWTAIQDFFIRERTDQYVAWKAFIEDLFGSVDRDIASNYEFLLFFKKSKEGEKE